MLVLHYFLHDFSILSNLYISEILGFHIFWLINFCDFSSHLWALDEVFNHFFYIYIIFKETAFKKKRT